MEVYKKFSRDLYDENDRLAKDIACEFLVSKGMILEIPLNEQSEMYKMGDFYIKYKNSNLLIEVERKKVWYKHGEWQGYDTVDIPYRKKDTKSNVFIMVNNSCDTIAVIPTKKILSSNIQTKDTIYTQNEKFFKVNSSDFNFYHKKNDLWIKI